MHEHGEHRQVACEPGGMKFIGAAVKNQIAPSLVLAQALSYIHHGRELYGCLMSQSTTTVWWFVNLLTNVFGVPVHWMLPKQCVLWPDLKCL